MSNGVQFEDENYSVPGSSLRDIYEQKLGFLENLVIKTGIVSTKEQAKYVLIGVIVACMIITVFVLARSSGVKSPKIPTDVLQRMKMPM